MAGWVLDLRRHTVTGVIRAAGAVRHKHISSYHRFFSRARWTTDEVGLTLDEAGWTLLCMPRHPLGDRARRVALEFAASGWHPQPGVLSARTPVGDASR